MNAVGGGDVKSNVDVESVRLNENHCKYVREKTMVQEKLL